MPVKKKGSGTVVTSRMRDSNAPITTELRTPKSVYEERKASSARQYYMERQTDSRTTPIDNAIYAGIDAVTKKKKKPLGPGY